jgi:hypothetical protein
MAIRVISRITDSVNDDALTDGRTFPDMALIVAMEKTRRGRRRSSIRRRVVSGGIAIALIGTASIAFGVVVGSEPGETNRYFAWDTSTAALVIGLALVALGAVLVIVARRVSGRTQSIVGRSIWATIGAAVAFVLIFPALCTAASTGPEECQALIGFRYVLPGWPSWERLLILNGVVAALIGALIWFLPVIVRRARAGRANRLGSA